MDGVYLLEQLSNSDNSIRSNAELQYQNIKSEGGDKLILFLLNILATNDVRLHIRKLSAVLLRRLLIEQSDGSSGTYELMSVQGQSYLRQNLLNILTVEMEQSLRTSLCDIIGELAGFIIEPKDWPEILVYTYNNIQSNDFVKKEIGLSLLGMISNSHIEILLSSQSNISTLLSIFQNTFIDLSNDGRVALASLQSLSSILININQQSRYEPFQQLIPYIFQCLSMTINTAFNSLNLKKLPCTFIEILIEIIEEKDSFFENHLINVLDTIISLIETLSQSTTEELISIRHLLIEFLVVLISNSPKHIRKLKNKLNEKYYYINTVLTLLTKFMINIPDDASWESRNSIEGTESNDPHDEQSDNNFCEIAFDKITQVLGVRCTYTIVTNIISNLLVHGNNNNQWKYLYTGLRILGNYMEVTSRLYDKSLLNSHYEQVISTTIHFIQSSSYPRVKYAALFAFSQFISIHGKNLITYYNNNLQNDYKHLTILFHTIMNQLHVSTNPSTRIRRNLLGCLMNLIDCSPTKFIENQLSTILNIIISTINESLNSYIVLEFCIQCIVSLCETIRGNSISNYYKELVNILKNLLQLTIASTNSLFYYQIFECVTIIGESSGKLIFYNDAIDMMNILISKYNNDKDDSNESNQLILKSWVRIARCLGADFKPYLSLVMDKLFQLITQNLSEGTGDIDLNDDTIDERSDIQIVENSDGSYQIMRTSAIEEQSLACQLVVLISEKLQENVYEYVDRIIRDMIPLLFSPHEDVRSYCMVVIPEVIRSINKYHSINVSSNNNINNIIDYSLEKLLFAIQTETLIEIIMTGLISVKHMILYACTDWNELIKKRQLTYHNDRNIDINKLVMDDPPMLLPKSSTPILTIQNINQISSCLKILLRDSIQKRGLLRAEAQISGGADEDDIADELILMSESLELHFNISEVIGMILRSHGYSFYSIYRADWHDIIIDMTQSHAIKEDQQFGLYIISDMLEFCFESSDSTYNSNVVSEYLAVVLPIILHSTGYIQSIGPRQAASYCIGVIAIKYSNEFSPYINQSIQCLGRSIAMGENTKDEIGDCVDNSVASIGLILDIYSTNRNIVFEYDITSMWMKWLDYLPIRHDIEEGKKSIQQLIRLVTTNHPSFIKTPNYLIKSITILLTVLQTNLSTNEIDNNIKILIHQIVKSSHSNILNQLSDDLKEKLDNVLNRKSVNNITTSIHDIVN